MEVVLLCRVKTQQRRMAACLAAVFSSLLAVTSAHAFCGFYVSGGDAKLFNNATEVVLMRDGTRMVLAMQNNYEGPPQNFALVVPVPVVLQKENVKTLPRALFDKLDQLSAPRLVEYWEQDPCYVPPRPRPSLFRRKSESAPHTPSPAAPPQNLGVTVEAQFDIDEYEVLILSAEDAGGLEKWLRREKYKVPDGSAPYFRPYVDSGSKFFVAKVNPEKVTFKNGMATLSPLRFHYDSDRFALPIRLGLVNAKGPQDLIVHVLARGKRFEAANYPNVTIPTNLDVAEDARKEFGPLYVALFDRTVEKTPKAVVTEYAWSTSSCDPCPGPTLTPGDLLTLGADVMPSTQASPERPGAASVGYDWVVTRLHSRYTKESLGEDLVFREAKPVVGGREHIVSDGKLEHGAREDTVNNFQARYAIRHPWTGPIACDHPRRNVWGGPPPGQSAPGTSAAKDTAFAPRGTVELAKLVRTDAPEIDLVAATVAGATPMVQGDIPRSPAPKKGCGCDLASARAVPPSEALAVALGALVFVWRRRARK